MSDASSNIGPVWYCFQALPKKEHIAAQLIRTEIEIDAFAPRIRYLKRTQRGRVHFNEPLFPGYIFVHADLALHLRRLLAVNGVRRLVTYGERVPEIPSAFIDELRARLGGDTAEPPPPTLATGTTVVVEVGPFKNIEAVVSGQIPAKNRVVLLLEFLGRQIAVQVPTADVAPKDSPSPREKIWGQG